MKMKNKILILVTSILLLMSGKSFGQEYGLPYNVKIYGYTKLGSELAIDSVYSIGDTSFHVVAEGIDYDLSRGGSSATLDTSGLASKVFVIQQFDNFADTFTVDTVDIVGLEEFFNSRISLLTTQITEDFDNYHDSIPWNNYWHWTSIYLRSLEPDGIWLKNTSPSVSLPNLGFRNNDLTTGFGSPDVGRIAFFASGVNAAQFEDDYFRSNVNFEVGGAATSLQFKLNDTSFYASDLIPESGSFDTIPDSYNAVYLNTVNGDDSNDGFSLQYPKLTFTNALTAAGNLQTANGGKVTLYIDGNIALTTNPTIPDSVDIYAPNTIISSVTPTKYISLGADNNITVDKFTTATILSLTGTGKSFITANEIVPGTDISFTGNIDVYLNAGILNRRLTSSVNSGYSVNVNINKIQTAIGGGAAIYTTNYGKVVGSVNEIICTNSNGYALSAIDNSVIDLNVNKIDMFSDTSYAFITETNSTINVFVNEYEGVHNGTGTLNLTVAGEITASDISVSDLGAYYDSTTVEGILQEIAFLDSKVESSSRTIYVETTGDDDTGDGTSVETAFATIGSALKDIGYLEPGVDIVVQLGLGSFTLSAEDAYNLCNKGGNGLIRIRGTLTTIYSNVNHTTSNTFTTTINTIDGSSVTLTDNELNGYFIRNNIDSASFYDTDYLYHPIARNTGNVLDIAGYYHTATVTGRIVELGTTIYIGASGGSFYTPSSSILNTSQNQIDFRELNMYFSDYTFIGSTRGISLRNIKTVNSGGYQCPIIELPDLLNITGCIFGCKDRINSGTVKNSIFTSAIGCYTSGTVKFKNILFYGNTIGVQTDGTKEGIIMNFSLDETSMKFLNVGRCFNASLPVRLINSELANWEFEGTSYFVRNLYGSWDGFRVFLDGEKVTGAPTSWDYSGSTSFYRNNTTSLIYFKGLTYPDNEYNLEESLTNATQNDITVGDINSNRSIVIDYTIERGSLFEEGQIRVLYNGTTLQFLQPSDLKQDNNSGSGIGITFDVDFDATDTDLINLEITLDSGDDATLKYDVRRKML